MIRSIVGVLFDINQNYFSGRTGRNRTVQAQRFNYHAAAFAVNGYTKDAERFAIAHQIFLIDYTHVPLMRRVADALLSLEIEDIAEPLRGKRKSNLTRIRRTFSDTLTEGAVGEELETFSGGGTTKIREQLLPSVARLRGSYYGMIEGIYPIHLVSERPIPTGLIGNRREFRCKIRVSDDDQTWAFEPSEVNPESPDFFHLEFSIPDFVAAMLSARTNPNLNDDIEHRHRVAEIKRQHMRYIDILTYQDERLSGFRLTLDTDWLNRYVRGLRARRPRRDDEGEARD